MRETPLFRHTDSPCGPLPVKVPLAVLPVRASLASVPGIDKTGISLVRQHLTILEPYFSSGKCRLKCMAGISCKRFLSLRSSWRPWVTWLWRCVARFALLTADVAAVRIVCAKPSRQTNAESNRRRNRQLLANHAENPPTKVVPWPIMHNHAIAVHEYLIHPQPARTA